jgi:hypothetical protein
MKMAIIALIAFWFAAAVYIWKLIEEGPKLTTLISAISFPIAAILWTRVVINLNKRRKDK